MSKHLTMHSSVVHGVKLSFREALGGLKKDDGAVHAEDVLRMLEEVNMIITDKVESVVVIAECL